MISPISGSNPVVPVIGPQPVAAQPGGRSAGQPTAPAPRTQAPDSVHLSPAAQAKVFEHQGMNVKQIASSMGVTASVINSYLGLNLTAAAPGAVPGKVKVNTNPKN